VNNDMNKYKLFNVAESKEKILLHLPSFLYVKTDDVDPRNKQK